MTIHYKFLREEGDEVIVMLNNLSYSFYSPQFYNQLCEKIEELVSRRLTPLEDSIVWDLNTEDKSLDF